MKRFTMLALMAILVLGVAVGARAATEVKMTGDAFVYGIFVNHQNFTGWNAADWTGANSGSQTEDSFQIWERFRLRTDFVANEAVKFRLGLKVQDTWGHGTLTAANPSAAISVYQAYLQFKLPDCNIEVTAGLQDLSLPANAFFCDSVVFGGDRAAALVINAPIVPDTFSVIAGFSRMLDTNRTYDTTTTQIGDELDAYFLALPITLNGFKATPWGAIAVAGRGADYYTNGSYGNTYFAENLVSAGSAMTAIASGNTNNIWSNNQNVYWWAGGAFEVSALDPVKFYADVVYGAGAMNDRKSSRRQGWFIDLGAEYTGLDFMTPQVFAWWSTGEDKSNRNGSERLPTIMTNWGPGNSFLFDNTQDLLKQGNMSVNPVGSYGIGASLNNVTFVEKLSHRLTFVYLRGNNSPRAIRAMNYYTNGGNLNLGANPYFIMGRDLTYNESLMSLNFDTTYQIYENLAAVLETGWAHGYFQTSVWGHRFTSKSESNGGNAWKVAFGLTYKF